MGIELGTRKMQTFHKGRTEGGSETRSHTRDLGLKGNVTASLTFTASNGRATGAGATFTGKFAAGDPVLVSGTNKNNGFFTVISTDDNTYVQLDPPVKDEGPLTATIRTS